MRNLQKVRPTLRQNSGSNSTGHGGNILKRADSLSVPAKEEFRMAYGETSTSMQQQPMSVDGTGLDHHEKQQQAHQYASYGGDGGRGQGQEGVSDQYVRYASPEIEHPGDELDRQLANSGIGGHRH